MIPKIFHLTARSKQLTWEEGRLMARLRQLHPDWTVRLWDDDDNRAMVQQHFPDWLAAYDAISRGVAKADIARYMYMALHGGVYLDTDYKVVRRFDFPLPDGCCGLPISRGSPADIQKPGFRLGNAILFSHPGHPFWTALLTAIFATLDGSALVESSVEETTGPEALTKVYQRGFASDVSVVLPERQRFHAQLTMGGFSYLNGPDTFGAHLCWGSWRQKPLPTAVRTILRRKLTSIT